MTNHAGFAAVAEVTDGTLTAAVEIYHRAGAMPFTIQGSQTVPTPLGPILLTYDLYLDPPRIRCGEPPFPGQMGIAFSLAGAVSAAAPGGAAAFDRQLLLTTEVAAQPVVALSGDAVLLRVDVPSINVVTLDAAPLDGQPVPANVLAVLRSPAALTFLTGLLRAAMAGVDTMSPPLFVPLLQQLGVGGAVTVADLQLFILEGAVAVGLNLGPGTLNFSTAGPTEPVPDFLGKSSLALCINPALLPILALRVRQDVIKAALQSKIMVDDFWIQAEETNLRVGGHAFHDENVGASFTMRARPVLGTPDQIEKWDDEYGQQHTMVTPGSPDIWLDIFDVQIEEEVAWWMTVLVAAGLIGTGPAAPVAVAALYSVLDSVRQNIARQVEVGVEGNVGPSRTQRVTMPGTDAPLVDLTVTQLKVGTAGLQSRLAFLPLYTSSPSHPDVQIVGPRWLWVDVLAQGTLPVLVFTLSRPASRYHPADPRVRVQWQVRNGLDKGMVWVTKDRPQTASDAHEVILDLNVGDRRDFNFFEVTARVYRVGPASVEEVVKPEFLFRIGDRLDRTRKYVRWWHTPNTPKVRIHPSGQREVTGYGPVKRKSRIHRTAFPGRCREVGSFSDAPGVELSYFDDLPFPVGEIPSNRRQLCDYCFFGGPDKDELIVDP